MTIGVISPSAPSTHTEMRRMQYMKGLETLRCAGYKVIVASHTEDNEGYISSSRENRLADFHVMFSDPNIDIVLAANGGRNSSHLLDGIDWELVRRSGKMLVGFSDISALLNAMYAKTGMRQIHGPMVTWGFDRDDKITNESFARAVGGQPQRFEGKKYAHFLRGEKMEGIAVGGNLSSVRNLLGTEYEPEWGGKIFFWEDTNECLNSVDRMLTHFKQAGVFSKIGGMIIGHLDNVADTFSDKKKDVIETIISLYAGFDFPILLTECFGHNVTEIVSIPIGGRVRAGEGWIELD